MPTFSNSLPDKTERRGYDLRRTPADKPIKGLITCDKLIGCYTHWWGGRTMPCENEGCEACQSNTPSRWHCYLSLFESGTHDHIIFECTAKAALPITEFLQDNPTLRGIMLTAWRPKRRRNARVEIFLKPIDISSVKLPKAPDLIQVMSVIWQLPGAAVASKSAERSMAKITTDQKILNAQRFNPADGNGAHTRKRKVKT